MNDAEQKEFIEEGLKRYKEASKVMVYFGKRIEKMLIDILENRDAWGNFTRKNKARAKSTTYWSEYPLLNAKLKGEFQKKDAEITIAVNWYASKLDYPFYSVWMTNSDPTWREKFEQFDWGSRFETYRDQLKFDPDPKDFDLERDFHSLLDEFNKFLSA